MQVWAYSNVDTVELFLNGRSLGVRRFDTKTAPDGTKYLETTECSGDDRNVTGGACPGSYQSPNGSSGKLHLIWNVPFVVLKVAVKSCGAFAFSFAGLRSAAGGPEELLPPPQPAAASKPAASRAPTVVRRSTRLVGGRETGAARSL